MTSKEFEKLFLDLNSVLVKFWVEQGRPDKEIKIELLERMLNWYKKMGYVTLDAKSTSDSSEIPADLEEAAKKFVGYDMDCDELRDYEMGIAAFLAGADWQKEQMMKEAVEGLFQNTPFPTICLDDCKDYDFKDGDKVQVIVIPNTDEK